MPHRHFPDETLVDFVYGHLASDSPDKARDVARAIRSCSVCRDAVHEIREQKAAMEHAAEHPYLYGEPPQELRDRIAKLPPPDPDLLRRLVSPDPLPTEAPDFLPDDVE